MGFKRAGGKKIARIDCDLNLASAIDQPGAKGWGVCLRELLGQPLEAVIHRSAIEIPTWLR